jgi:hypothetical protein
MTPHKRGASLTLFDVTKPPKNIAGIRDIRERGEISGLGSGLAYATAVTAVMSKNPHIAKVKNPHKEFLSTDPIRELSSASAVLLATARERAGTSPIVLLLSFSITKTPPQHIFTKIYAVKGVFITFLSISRIFCLDVNTADRTLENADLCRVAAGLDNAGLFLDADDLADDTANRGDLVANLKIVSHVSNLLILFFLLTEAEEHYDSQDHYHSERDYHGSAATLLLKHKCQISHFLKSFLKYKYSITYSFYL